MSQLTLDDIEIRGCYEVTNGKKLALIRVEDKLYGGDNPGFYGTNLLTNAEMVIREKNFARRNIREIAEEKVKERLKEIQDFNKKQ